MAQALHSEFRTDARSLEDRARIMLDLFPDALKAYADIGRSLATGEDDDHEAEGTDVDAVDALHVEAVESCACGSGHPQRECCGKHRVLH
jgi:hypothetical protein